MADNRTYFPPRHCDIHEMEEKEVKSLRKLAVYLWSRIQEDVPVGSTIDTYEVRVDVESFVRPINMRIFLSEMLSYLPIPVTHNASLFFVTGKPITVESLRTEEWQYECPHTFRLMIRKNHAT